MGRTLTWLAGRRFESVARDEDCDAWVFSFDGPLSLRVASPWRIVDLAGVIRLGWRDHGHWFGRPRPVDGEKRALSLLGESPIVEANADETSADLLLRVEKGPALQVFNYSCAYEGWQLYGEGGRAIVGVGGGGTVDYGPGGEMRPPPAKSS